MCLFVKKKKYWLILLLIESYSPFRLPQRPWYCYLLGLHVSVTLFLLWAALTNLVTLCVYWRTEASIHWIYRIKLVGKWEHRIHLLCYCIITVVVWITATWQQLRHVVCIRNRGEAMEMVVEKNSVCCASVFLVASYLGRRVVKGRLYRAGVVVWRSEGRR